MTPILYDDGAYRVSSAVIATPTRFYPLANTTASLRRDPLWVGIALTVFAGLSVRIYGDLLFPMEKVWLLGGCAAALLIGWHVVILRIAAPGHRRAILIGRRKRMKSLYEAIWRARTIDPAIIMTSEDHGISRTE